jgi:hypothetical protein
MTRKNLDEFPQDEQDDFYRICNQHNIDPATLDAWANEEYLGTGPMPIHRMVYIKRLKRSGQDPAIAIELTGSVWLTEFEEKIGLLQWP